MISATRTIQSSRLLECWRQCLSPRAHALGDNCPAKTLRAQYFPMLGTKIPDFGRYYPAVRWPTCWSVFMPKGVMEQKTTTLLAAEMLPAKVIPLRQRRRRTAEAGGRDSTMAESKQRQKDRERLAQLRADTSEVWNSPRVVKVSGPAMVPSGPEGSVVVSSQREPQIWLVGCATSCPRVRLYQPRCKGTIFSFPLNLTRFWP